MLRERVLSAVVFVPVVVAAFYLGGAAFYFLLATLAFLGGLEYREMLRKKDVEIHVAFPFLAAIVAASSSARPWAITVALVGAAMILLVLGLWRGGFASAVGGLAGLVYLGAFAALLGVLRGASGGREWAFLVLGATWATDVVAYFVGSLAGRRRIAPGISPGKTWEGAISGVIAASLAAYGLSRFWKMDPVFALMAGALLGVAAELGDLVESALKRFAGVKDSGKIIPGHGGVLDRFDSLLFSGATGLFLHLLYRILILGRIP
ncbi:MAG: phosphatidate cytidylyltransferase [Firmicutes bacterium]|nr:phosphatidate cytidylyltransferase [Candidatus Fermentithermobacillaceae bacterium]